MKKLGDLHNMMMEKEIPVPAHLGNNNSWNTGYRAGAYRAKMELSTIGLRYEGYTKELEKMLTAIGVNENILAQIQKEFLL